MSDKHESYRGLTSQRKACRLCHPALLNPALISAGSLDSDRIGPYSRWQGNLDAELMVVAQDFADVEGFKTHRGCPGEHVATNTKLACFLGFAGITITPPRFGVSEDRLFFTNAVLCMKNTNGMRGPIPQGCVRACGERFLRPLIELVEPFVVVSLGLPAAVAVCTAFGRKKPTSLSEIVAVSIHLNDVTTLVPLYHPAASRSATSQRTDWIAVSDVLKARRAD